MAHRTFQGSTVESYKEPEADDCTECGSDRTSTINFINHIEIRRCHDCGCEFEKLEE
jgi:NMD protein affecting ribosome stability and mRNA decay